MAKTNGFGFQPGRNMCKQVSKDVVIVFAVLKLEVAELGAGQIIEFFGGLW